MEKKDFKEMMETFSKVYEKGLSTDVLKIYFEIFKEIPNDKTKFITKECLKRCRYFPRPADVFDCLEEEDQFFDLPDLE